MFSVDEGAGTSVANAPAVVRYAEKFIEAFLDRARWLTAERPYFGGVRRRIAELDIRSQTDDDTLEAMLGIEPR
jgi:hypothetical protein